MELNILAFGYLFLRLAPFILVCFFTLSSIFNQDYKGFIYLIGLLFACFFTTTLGSAFGDTIKGWNSTGEEILEICNMVPILQDSNLSVLPLGQTVLNYTFFYMLYNIIKNGIVTQNWPMLLFFPCIILFDLVWNIRYKCNAIPSLLISLVIGGGCGYLWGHIISTTNSVNLQYYSGVNDKETCSVPAKNTFKCNVYRNGALVTSTSTNSGA
jgi:hypothetical protein